MTRPCRPCMAPFPLWNTTRWLHLLLVAGSGMAAFTSEPRWGQATAVANNLLVVHGGKTDEFNEFSYTSAPTTNDLFYLELSQSFNPSSPPWQYISGSQNSSSPQGPELAWHTLSTYSSSNLLLFGGDGGPNSPIVLPSQSNSAELLNVSSLTSPIWSNESEGWAGEPPRRIHHSTASNGGRVFLVGGEKDDGSANGYSDHYVFDPSTPSFTQLPSDNGPPDIYGHASAILSDGRMLVFGGYSQSEAQLIPFTTIWSMNTSASTLSWTTESVSSSSVPPGRRAFASTWIEGDRILIQGGSDADLQTSYSDGWILDTTTNPMTWSNISALTQVGARRDHFAAQAGSQVLFGFGYGINSAASVGLVVFDCSSNSVTSSFTPQSSPSHTTLPASGGTGSPSSGSGTGSDSNPTDSSGNGNNPGGSDPNGTSSGSHSTSPASPGDGDGSHHSAIIAVAAVLSILGIAAAVVFIVIIVLRRKQARRRFRLLEGDESDSPSPPRPWTIAGFAVIPWFGSHQDTAQGEKARMTGENEGWTVLGFGRRHQDLASPRRRIDMLANEDASEYANGPHRRFGSGSSRSWYSTGQAEHQRFGSVSSGRPSFRRIVSDSLGSLKNVGVGVRRVISGGAPAHSRHGTDSSNPWDPYFDYEDGAGLLLHDRGSDDYEPESPVLEKSDWFAARPRGGRKETSEFSKYSDPFKDSDGSNQDTAMSTSGDVQSKTDGSSSIGMSSTGAVEDGRSSQSRASRLSVPYQVHPITTTISKASSDDPSLPSLLTASNAGHSSSSSSQQVLTTPSSSRPRTSSLIGSVPTSPVKRSDSWWSRFKSSTLRDNLHERSKSQIFRDMEIRDPNPPPVRLGAIKEGSGGSTEKDSPESAHSKGPSSALPSHVYYKSGHERSTTSLKTSQTADSGKLERLAKRLDVVVREGTGSSDYSPSFTDSTETGHDREGTWSSVGRADHERRPTSPNTSLDVVDSNVLSEIDGSRPIVESPPRIVSPSLTSPLAFQAPTILPINRKATQGGNVAARVAEYERRASLDISSPTSPSGARTPQERAQAHDKPPPGERRGHARPKSTQVKYGLVQRPELFVANPDRNSRDLSSS